MARIVTTMGGLMAAYLIYLEPPTAITAWFPWHIFFMTIGVYGFMSYSVLNFVFNGKKAYNQTVWFHFVLNALAAACILLGFVAIYTNKETKGKTHWKSWHGTIGFYTFVLIMGMTIGNISFLFPDQMVRAVGPKTVKKIKLVHRIVGTLAYVFVMFEMFLAYYSNWFNRNVTGVLWYLFPTMTLLMAAIVVVQVAPKFFR
ncbi:uncharacterized protein MONBRDRAFT_38409 [Monosiga brevicollis MX1]|uniref:Cytochrome b561 domain-containing protein n=1 Tax=Monosiga brevicollis TaxID=81824 RepID=A9V7K3_MONBE|nr:uncharacterized protein MONBRDRAFT_38409 [Monosiga brevicollis MX1]EDQ86531.1 predicted protein [Monosiga brevicollis MX1]|eukprot:XP_001748644.1 hypothetical protein [Monosiga brevicollis MX1]